VNKLTKQLLLATCLSSVAMTSMAVDYKTEKARLSYAIGVNMGNSLKQQGITDVDAKAIGQAIADVIAGAKFKVSEQDMQQAVQAFQKKLMAQREAEAGKHKVAGDKFRAENKKRKGVKELPNGIQYEVLKEGKGDKPKVTDKVTVHYHGTLVDGTVFDSSVKRGEPASFPLNGVIKGWQEVLPMMPVGAKWKVVIPPELAYGDRGAGKAIGPNSTLVFEIELISIDK
jgi:FKBP-type peptidyl-prolyl cis-trans isomerase FklB